MLKIAFLRNILILSILIAFSMPFYEAYYIHPSYRAMLIEQTEQEAARYGRYLINTLNLDLQVLKKGTLPARVASEVGAIRKDRLLIKLRFFSPSGEIIYSTEPSELGVINQKDYFVNIVARGDFFSKVVEKHALTADGQPTTIDVVETYVPIMGNDRFNGAIEVYYDISQALASLNELSGRTIVMLTIIVTGLMLSIILSLRRAYDSHCKQQLTEQLLTVANEELEERVADRTKDLHLSNQDLQDEVAKHLQTTKELQQANEFNRTVIDSMHDAVSIIDSKTFHVVACNTVFAESLKQGTAKIAGKTCYALTHGLDEPCSAPDHDCPLVETVKSGEYASFDHEHRDKDGNIRYVEVSTSPIFDENNSVIQVVHVSRDVTEKKLAADEIEQMAYYDPLTGLPNRRMLLDRLEQAIPHAARNNEKLALLFLDLDRFKEINDTRGHTCGDQILRAVAERLSDIVRGSDTLARLGGDEFVFLLTGISSEVDASIVAEKILSAIRDPLSLPDCQVHMTTSIGIALFPADGADSETLLKGADMALYSAKSTGRNAFKFFSEQMDMHAQERHDLENRMHSALDNNEFYLVFQPQVDARTGRVFGVEALARWQDPERGGISPGQFIPVAEDSGLILPLGDWVLEEACQQAKQWYDQGYEHRCVAVNISVRQFQQPDFVDKVRIVLARTGLPANLLELELTESLLMQNGEASIGVLRDLKMVGVKLSIDDFGTGYSSLSYLKDFPIDRIKIDQSFVRDINDDENDRIIVETIIAMAAQLKLEVVAEGVETEKQRDTLLARKCHLIQGFLYAKPMLPEELGAFEEKLNDAENQRSFKVRIE